MNSVIYLIKCRLLARKLHNIISFIVVALCVAVIIIALSLSNGFERSLIDKIIIASPHVSIFGDYDSLLIPEKNMIQQRIRLAQVQALAINPENKQVQGVLLRGVDPRQFSKLFNGDTVLISGNYPGPGEVIIGNKFAENCDLKTGDTLKILTGPAISDEYNVSGIFKVGLYDFDSGVILAPYDNVINLSPEPGEGVASEVRTFHALWLKNPFYAQLFASELLKSNPSIFVANWQDDNKSLVSAISLEKKIIFLVLLLLVVAASVAIANSQFIQILAQREQIAIMGAMGFEPQKILYVFIIEGLIIGFIGSLIGLVFSVVIVYYLGNYPVSLPMDIYQVDTIPVKLEFMDVILTMFSAIFMVCISSIVPAFYASRLNPVEILRRI